MENGIAEVHLISLPSEVTSLKIVDTSYCPPAKTNNSATSPNNNKPASTRSRTPSPSKKGNEFQFIDDGNASSSSSATSTKERDKPPANQHRFNQVDEHESPAETSGGSSQITLQGSSPPTSPQKPPMIPPSSSPPSSIHVNLPDPDVYEMTPAPTRRLPTVVVLGYQRAVAESQAAAERMQQRQHQHTGRQFNLTVGEIGGLMDHGVPPSPHGRNSRVRVLWMFDWFGVLMFNIYPHIKFFFR